MVSAQGQAPILVMLVRMSLAEARITGITGGKDGSEGSAQEELYAVDGNSSDGLQQGILILFCAIGIFLAFAMVYWIRILCKKAEFKRVSCQCVLPTTLSQKFRQETTSSSSRSTNDQNIVNENASSNTSDTKETMLGEPDKSGTMSSTDSDMTSKIINRLKDSSDKVSLTKVTITRSKFGKLGLKIGDRQNHVGDIIPVIVGVKGLAANTALRPGMRILTVNGNICEDRDRAIKLLQGKKKKTGNNNNNNNTVTITAGPLHAVAGTIYGMEFDVSERSVDHMVKLKVGKIPSSHAMTGLERGMLIHQINGENVNDLEKEGMVMATAARARSHSEEGVTVIATTPGAVVPDSTEVAYEGSEVFC